MLTPPLSTPFIMNSPAVFVAPGAPLRLACATSACERAAVQMTLVTARQTFVICCFFLKWLFFLPEKKTFPPESLREKKQTSYVPRDGRFPGDPHGRVGWGWGGVGDDNVLCTCTHGRCYATSWDGVGWGGVGDDNVPCTCTHGRCYATSTFLYLHTWSLLRNIMGWGGVRWGGGWSL